MNADELKLWEKYLRKPKDDVRNELVLRYLPIAKTIAAKFAAKIVTIPYQEFLSAASYGLLQAVPKFQLTGGANPNTFLAFRIAGEIRDYLRSQDYLSRSDRKKLNIVSQWAERQFAAGRIVSDDDIQTEFGKLPVGREPRSLSAVVAVGERKELTGEDCLIDPTVVHPRDALRDLLRNLNQTERFIVLMYADGMRMKDIGTELGLSESRVSQMVKALRPRLHASAVRYGYGYFFKGDRDALPSRLRKAV